MSLDNEVVLRSGDVLMHGPHNIFSYHLELRLVAVVDQLKSREHFVQIFRLVSSNRQVIP